MSEAIESSRSRSRWKRLSSTLSTKLILTLVATMVAIFSLLGFQTISHHRDELEALTLQSAERVSDVIKRSTSYYMLRNDREGLYHIINTMADEPGMIRIRIFNQEGKISFSTSNQEVNTYVDQQAEACYACHLQTEPLVQLNRPDRFRIYRLNGERVLGIINPIENQPSCSTAVCHAHPESQKILGVLDTNLSLAGADANLSAGTREILIYMVLAILLISVLTFVFVRLEVHGPLGLLKSGTERLSEGHLGHQIQLSSHDELGELAGSFNEMSRQLHEAHEEITQASRLLEERVAQKTRELKLAQRQMIQVEKMASIGKLAAIVAHEINNPLSGILTYAKLLRKWTTQTQEPLPSDLAQKMSSSLELIETESQRCGDIVKNLMMFARSSPMNPDWTDLNGIVCRCVKLVQHQADVNNVQIHLNLDEKLPKVRCDSAQIEQVVLAMVVNAIEATHANGGSVALASHYMAPTREVQLLVEDEGMGIPPEIVPRLFEPFFSTKENGRGTGLGLAISQSIVERHSGKIEVHSEVGVGAKFTVTLPVDTNAPEGFNTDDMMAEAKAR